MSEPAGDVRQLVDRYWSLFLEQEPLFATAVGEERFDDQLPDPSEEGLARRERIHRSALEVVDRFERSRLDLESRAALDLMEFMARRELDFIRLRLDRFWAVSHMFGAYFFGPAHLLGQIGELQRADTPERVDRYLARLSRVPAYFDGVIALIDEAQREGQTAPGIVVDRAIDLVEEQLKEPLERSPAMTPVEEASAEDRDRVVATLRDGVFPALARYRESLEGYRPYGRDTIGLLGLPAGEEMYAAEILGWTTLAIDPKEVHELGLQQTASIEEERRRIAQRLGHTDAAAAIAEHTATGKNTPSSRTEVLDLARDQVLRSWEAASQFFGRLPKENCEVRPVEEYREAHVLDYYQSPTTDGSRPGIFYVNTAERPLHSLATTTYHETNPGHHFQAMIDLEAGARPPLRRHANELQGLAFAEGWGLYSERLADEMGLYRDDYERLGMLELQAMRAARLVVDTGIHVLGWPRDRAIATLEDTGLPPWQAATEIDRYIAMPAQALCYKLGQLEIERWRGEASRRAGSGFSLGAFHDGLLALGALPLPTLRRELEGNGG